MGNAVGISIISMPGWSVYAFGSDINNCCFAAPKAGLHQKAEYSGHVYNGLQQFSD